VALLGFSRTRAEQYFAKTPPALPDHGLLSSEPETYWKLLRSQWLLSPGHINLNCGSLGCTPLPVLHATIDHILEAETFADPGYPWFGYEENKRVRETRQALAGFLKCKIDELALVRNATEGNNVVCNGLDLKPGDEVVMTDQEHAGGRCCWEQKAARFGIKLKFVSLPKPPESSGQIVDLFEKALTPATRVVFFSHITSPTGLILPAKEISAVCRKRGIISHADGAHAIGQIPLDMHDLGCDFYVTSPHKWLMAPKGTGTLFIREEMLDRLWVNVASAEWNNKKLKAYRFSNIGTSNLSSIVGLKAALDFVQTIGPERIYKRIKTLATSLRDQIEEIPRLKTTNASRDEFFGGLVSFAAKQGDLKSVLADCAARKIRTTGGPNGVRVATHIFTQRSDIDTFAEVLRRNSKS
jgi:selenocysteine lyase/cysteine desulfurase